MFSLLFPKIIDNKFRGQWLALVLFAPMLLLKLIMGFNIAGFNPMLEVRDILQDVDGVPLDTYGVEAASDLVSFANAWGLSLLTICLVGLVALLQYRAMIPFAILLLTVEQLGRKIMSVAESGFRFGPEEMTTGSMINWAFSLALVLALILSIIPRRTNSGIR